MLYKIQMGDLSQYIQIRNSSSFRKRIILIELKLSQNEYSLSIAFFKHNLLSDIKIVMAPDNIMDKNLWKYSYVFHALLLEKSYARNNKY